MSHPASASAVVVEPPAALIERLKASGQGHLLQFWPSLDAEGRARLLADLEAVPIEQVGRLASEFAGANAGGDAGAAVSIDRIEPIEVTRLPRTDSERVAYREAVERGESLLSDGQVGVIVVAGGQGTRLGFDGPKGTYPIGPVSSASLFQIHAEKVVALSRRYGRVVPFYVMTSPLNHDETVAFFAEHGQFGLEHVRFFTQGQMPAVDRESGEILMAAPDRLALSPDGHGGTLSALAAPGPEGGPSCLAEMRERGLTTLFYFQVDNPMVKIADPAFLGLHAAARAEVSFKVVEKVLPDERVGVIVRIDGVPQVIEYSDLPAELAEARVQDGGLAYWAGSIAIQVFDLGFIERLVAGDGQLPFHRAFKKVPYVADDGSMVKPAEPNAIKFERFIFDALPLAARATVVECDRLEEFEPLKNATGTESPATVRQRMSDQFGAWLESAGADVPHRSDGSVPFGIEISPLYALDAAELKRKLAPGLVVEGPLLLK
jgi:UDP-N-acetylglucosamine/UDP-N-acetylgalactosamine diphosphorylase